MKKTLLILTLLISLNFAFAQENLYGVRVGYNITNLNFKPEVPAGVRNMHRNGFAIGFLAQYGISDKFSVSPEILFSAEGAKDKELRLDYLQLPVFLDYKFCDKIAVAVGPQIGLKAHEYEDGFQNLMFSGVAKATYMITDVFFLDVRYAYGFTNIFDDNTGLEALNENLQIGFGLKM